MVASAGRDLGATGTDGPVTRSGVDAGVTVIDLAAMRAELEAGRG